MSYVIFLEDLLRSFWGRMSTNEPRGTRLLRTIPASWTPRKKDIPAGTVVYLTGNPASGDEVSISTNKDLSGSFTVPSSYLWGDD